MDNNALIERIKKLEAENAALKAKNRTEPKIQILREYNTDTHVSVEDAAKECNVPAHLDHISVNDVRAIVRLFGLEATAQFKTEDAVGRGILLYAREDMDRAIATLG